jgi:rubrerythrin
MQLTTKTKSLRRSRRHSQAPRRASEQRPRAALPVSQVRARRGGGIEDRALYTCECGFAWTGEVTASPSCPHCGQPQAW